MRFLWLIPCVVVSVWAADQPGQLANTMEAPPLSADGKFQYRVGQTVGLRGLVGSTIGATIAQSTNTPGEWGQGTEGYAKRFASNFAGNLTRQTFAFTLETVTHEDSRYFPSTEHGKARLLSVLKQTIFTKTDRGGTSFAYSRVISAFGEAQLANTWQPKSTSGVGDGIERGFLTLGTDAVTNLIQEFVPRLRPKALREKP